MRLGNTLLLIPLLAASAIAAEEPPDWHTVQRSVAQRLESEDVGAIARSLASEKSGDLEARLVRLAAFVRADHADRARAAVDALADAPRRTIESACMWLIDRERDDLARRLLAHRPDLRVGWTYVLMDRMVDTEGLNTTLTWVRARESHEPDVWLPERARLLQRHGEVAPLLDEMAASVREHPTDADAALRFLSLATLHDANRDMSWLADVVQTTGPVQDLVLGRALRYRAPQAALRVVMRAQERELGELDRAALLARLQHRQQDLLGGAEPDLERMFRSEARRELLDALMAAGETQDAQLLMEELTREAAEAGASGLPSPGWLTRAGEVQAASGHRVVEERVREAEEIDADDPAYWLKRSAYFTGREEWQEALSAAERALALTPLDANTDAWARRRAVDAVHGLVRRIRGEEAAYAYLHSELARVEAAGRFQPRAASGPSKAKARPPRHDELAHWIVRDMAFEYERHVSADDELLWRYLASVPALDHTTERLVWRMAENGGAGEEFWERILRIVWAGDPRGRQHLGFVMIVTGEPARAIPFLRESVALLAEGGDERKRCAFLIVRAGLESGDWRAAEAAWAIGRLHLGPDERPSRLARMALLAAQDGEPDAALRFWKRKANYDRGDMSGVRELAEVAPMRARLTEWYDQLAEEDPACGARNWFVRSLQTR